MLLSSPIRGAIFLPGRGTNEIKMWKVNRRVLLKIKKNREVKHAPCSG